VAPVRPDTAGASFAVSLMMLEVLDDNGRAILDQLAVDLVDRAAEKHIGAAIVAAAGGTRAAGSDLAAALDTAEAACGAGVESAADVLLVNPADWPKVRRAAAPSWQLGPHPEVGLSIGVPAGTVAFLSRAAVFAQIGRLQYASAGLSVQDASKHALNPAEFAANIGMFRHFRTIIRRPAGIQLVTLRPLSSSATPTPTATGPASAAALSRTTPPPRSAAPSPRSWPLACSVTASPQPHGCRCCCSTTPAVSPA
jgi:hypothetical protein